MGPGSLAAAGDLGGKSQLCTRTLVDTLHCGESNNKVKERQQKSKLALKKMLASASDTSTIKSLFVLHSSVEKPLIRQGNLIQ